MYSSSFIAVAVCLALSASVLPSSVQAESRHINAAAIEESVGIKPATVVFFWNGDEISTLYPNANIADVAARYQLRGIRVVQAVGLPPTFFRQFVMMDKKAHPEDYDGKQVTLVIHGHGARYVPKIAEIKKELAMVHAGVMATTTSAPIAVLEPASTPAPLDRVKEEEIILSFIEGIGEKAKAEAINSACFFGQECFAVSLEDTALAARVSRLIVPRRTSNTSLAGLIPMPTAESVLTRLSDILMPRSKD